MSGVVLCGLGGGDARGINKTAKSKKSQKYDLELGVGAAGFCAGLAQLRAGVFNR
jgi:hypothetical protein